jgi:hypothetical protein
MAPSPLGSALLYLLAATERALWCARDGNVDGLRVAVSKCDTYIALVKARLAEVDQPPTIGESPLYQVSDAGDEESSG